MASHAARPRLQAIVDDLERVAIRLERATERAAQATSFRIASQAAVVSNEEANGLIIRDAPPSFPNPLLLRRILRQRQLRARYFGPELFADPAWDMLLDLAAARTENRRVSVTSLCIASAVPNTTALRWIGLLVKGGLVEREEDDADHRRVYVSLTDFAVNAMVRYFDELGASASWLV